MDRDRASCLLRSTRHVDRIPGQAVGNRLWATVYWATDSPTRDHRVWQNRKTVIVYRDPRFRKAHCSNEELRQRFSPRSDLFVAVEKSIR